MLSPERETQAKVEELAEVARKSGGNFLCGGKRREGGGYFYEPTIVTGLTDGSRLVDEEPFGPILPVIKYRDIDEVIARANACVFRPSWTVIPREAGHAFQSKLDSRRVATRGVGVLHG